MTSGCGCPLTVLTLALPAHFVNEAACNAAPTMGHLDRVLLAVEVELSHALQLLVDAQHAAGRARHEKHAQRRRQHHRNLRLSMFMCHRTLLHFPDRHRHLGIDTQPSLHRFIRDGRSYKFKAAMTQTVEPRPGCWSLHSNSKYVCMSWIVAILRRGRSGSSSASQNTSNRSDSYFHSPPTHICGIPGMCSISNEKHVVQVERHGFLEMLWLLKLGTHRGAAHLTIIHLKQACIPKKASKQAFFFSTFA